MIAVLPRVKEMLQFESGFAGITLDDEHAPEALMAVHDIGANLGTSSSRTHGHSPLPEMRRHASQLTNVNLMNQRSLLMKAYGYANHSSTDKLKPFSFERRTPLPDDVAIDILYCGICHSDIHSARDEWGGTHYPFVPGHEIVGRVTTVGANVTKFKVGDRVGVGCLVDSCGHCESCQEGLEQYCENGWTGTYNSEDKIGGTPHSHTFGGYSDRITVKERFVLRMPENLDLAAAAPLLCAGVTTYSPLRHWKVGAGQKVGIIGLGGLGHMGIKLAHAMGAHVVMITTSPEKAKDAKKLGANEVLLSSDDDAMKAAQGSFDFLLNTIPVGHDVNPYIELLKRDATMVIVGAVEALTKASGVPFIFKRRSMAGSLIGGLPETQEMLDFCGKHNITCDIEMIGISDVNTAYDRTVKGDVKYRFVIDMGTLRKQIKSSATEAQEHQPA